MTGDDDTVRVWLVERTYSDDEQNVVILEYATPDGRRYLRKERALTSFDDDRATPASLAVDPERLAPVRNEAVVQRYESAAGETMADYDPDDEL